MKYLKIYFILLGIFASQIAIAAQTPDFSKSIFSGQFVPAPQVSDKSTAPASNAQTNKPPSANQSSPTKPALTAPLSLDDMNVPTINSPVNQSSSPKVTGGGGGDDTNYAPPPPPVLDDQQKQFIQDAKDYDASLKKVFDKDISENFDTYTFPKEYYQQPFTKQNSHLPPVDFASHYAALAFKYAKEDNLVNVRYFIKKYNFVDVYDLDGNNLLMVAVSYNSLKTARVLLANNIFYVNEHNKQNKRTALHSAVINNNFEMTRLLLTMGASPLIHDGAGMTALDYSGLLENSQVAQLLSAYKHK